MSDDNNEYHRVAQPIDTDDPVESVTVEVGDTTVRYSDPVKTEEQKLAPDVIVFAQEERV